MANENKEIGDIVKKCKILLLDIEGTTTSISFVKICGYCDIKCIACGTISIGVSRWGREYAGMNSCFKQLDKLFPYAEENVKQFLDSQWENADVKDAVVALRKLSIADKEGSVEGVVVIPGEDASKEEQIEGLVNNMKWQMSSDRKAGPLKQLQGLIWKQGYDNGDIKGHVFDDVSAALEAWHSADDQKVYIYSSGSVQAQKMLFAQSVAGDLLKYIDGHFDTAVGAKQEAASYTKIAEKIGCKPDEILFLTDIVKEAEAARSAGVCAALVSRAGNSPLGAAAAAFPVLHSLAELAPTNKRKPDPQEETPAAKILKTDSENDVKSTTETTETDTATTKNAEPPKMDVEETITSTEETKKVPEVKDQVIVEELDSNEATAVASVVDIEPAIEIPKEDKEDKTEQKETENGTAKKENGDAGVKESSTIEVMEVEEVAGDDKPLPDVAEIIEDVAPIVEEPDNNEDIDDLKNVGDVLEKECDEILSKVNDVTNLVNITVKSAMLKPIAEETMETDNTDSNDIVNRILDTEMDLEMKQCADIDPNTVTEMTEEAKTEVIEKNGVKEDSTAEKEEISVKQKKDTEKEEVAVAEKKDVTEKKEMETEIKESEIVSEKKETPSENKEIVAETKETVTEKEPVNEKEEPVTESNIEKVSESSPVQNKETQVEVSTADVATATEIKENSSAEGKKAEIEEVKPVEEVKPAEVEAVKESTPAKSDEAPVKQDEPMETAPQESKVETQEPQVNGKTGNDKPANGDVKDKPMNGDASKEEELSARLTDGAVENGKVNGSNEDSTDGEKGQGDCKVEAETNDLKVKSVTVDEPRTDPIEQPTEA